MTTDQISLVRTVNPFDAKKKNTNGFWGKEDETNMSTLSQSADTPQPFCNGCYGRFVLLPINFEANHNLVS